jgi:2-dehydro-3-deoxygalactonokinase
MKVFVDWGSTNFRAFLFDKKVLDRRHAAGGGTLKNFVGRQDRIKEYSSYLQQQTGDWLADHPQAPLYICGAAGGREGWVETSYTAAPATIGDIRGNLYKLQNGETGVISGRDIFIATGCAAVREKRHDVMRGEEVKALGAALSLGRENSLFCIPGTHCKWVGVEQGAITRFESAMTGEIYNLLHEKGALAAIIRNQDGGSADQDSLTEGLTLAAQREDLLSDIWQVRSQFLRNTSPPKNLSAYLSGILIGHELLQMERVFGKEMPLALLADDGVKKDFYLTALKHFGWNISGSIDSETAVCRGLEALAS